MFYVSLLEYDTTKQGRIDKMTSQLKFQANNKNEKYKVERVQDNAVYTRELAGHLPKLFYLVL